MNTALDVFYYIWDKLLSLVFNDLQIAPSVTVGWVLIAIIIIGFVTANILSVPRQVSANLYYGVSRYGTRKGGYK